MTLPGTVLTQGKAKVLNLVNEIVEAITLCSKEVNKISEIVKELHDLRVSKFQKLHREEVDCLARRTQLLGLKMK